MGWFSGEARSQTGRAHPERGDGEAGASNDTVAGFDRLTARQRRDLASLRRRAMRLVSGLDRIARGTAKDADDRLLGKSDGVIDGFNTLAQIIARIVDKERQSFGMADAPAASTRHDEQGLERRIADELDRIASRGGSPGGPGADRPDA